jgi:hypothetical protein
LGIGFLNAPLHPNQGNIVLIRFENGRAESLEILCHVFSKLQKNDKFHIIYLEKFYDVIKKGLHAEFVVLSAIISHSEYLFIMGLDGFRLLIPKYIKAFHRILPNTFEEAGFFSLKPELVKLRENSYRILGSIVLCLNRLGGIFLNTDFKNVQKFSDAEINNLILELYPTKIDTVDSNSSASPTEGPPVLLKPQNETFLLVIFLLI